MLANLPVEYIQNAARLRAEHYRELAIRYRCMAAQEFLPDLQRRLRTLALEYDEMADVSRQAGGA
jgi:hypothetical protein